MLLWALPTSRSNGTPARLHVSGHWAQLCPPLPCYSMWGRGEGGEDPGFTENRPSHTHGWWNTVGRARGGSGWRRPDSRLWEGGRKQKLGGQGRPQMPGLEGGAERRPPDPALWQHPVGVAADRPHSPGPWAPPIHCPGSSRGPDALSIAGGVLLGAGGGAPTESPRSPGPWQPTPVLLPGKSHGRRSSGGLQSMGSLRVGHD